MSEPAMRRVSLDELRRMSQWLLRSRGVRCGNEDEPAAAVVWLAARRDGVLEALWQELRRGALQAARSPLPAPAIDRVDSQALVADALGASAIMAAPAYLDWLMATNLARVHVRNLASPMWLFPHLALRPTLVPVYVEARDGKRTVMRLERDATEDIQLTLHMPWHRLWEVTCDVHMARSAMDDLHCARDESASAELLIASRMQPRAEQSRRRGIQVGEALWSRLTEATLEAMVPETEASRLRGAGGSEEDYQ